VNNEYYNYWYKHYCRFYHILDEILKQEDMGITISQQKAFLDFEYWLKHVNENDLIKNSDIVSEWFFNYAISDGRDLFKKGYFPIYSDDIKQTCNNIVKKTCKELGFTYKQLGDAIGVSEDTIKRSASTDKISQQVEVAIKLLLENNELKAELKTVEDFRANMQDFLKGGITH